MVHLFLRVQISNAHHLNPLWDSPYSLSHNKCKIINNCIIILSPYNLIICWKKKKITPYNLILCWKKEKITLWKQDCTTAQYFLPFKKSMSLIHFQKFHKNCSLHNFEFILSTICTLSLNTCLSIVTCNNYTPTFNNDKITFPFPHKKIINNFLEHSKI